MAKLATVGLKRVVGDGVNGPFVVYRLRRAVKLQYSKFYVGPVGRSMDYISTSADVLCDEELHDVFDFPEASKRIDLVFYATPGTNRAAMNRVAWLYQTIFVDGEPVGLHYAAGAWLNDQLYQQRPCDSIVYVEVHYDG